MVTEIEAASGLKMGIDFAVCFSPEFLPKATKINHFYIPPETVIETNDERADAVLEQIYELVDKNFILTSTEVAEISKYVDNVWHATKLCLAIEKESVYKPLDIDSHKVMESFFQDIKLNLYPPSARTSALLAGFYDTDRCIHFGYR